MKAAAPAAGASRWALSFADLCLLLLGFLILVHAEGKRGREVADAIRPALGGRPPLILTIAADTLFEPGEAVLRPAALARIAALGHPGRVDITSTGSDSGSARLDAWELAAARTAAIARAVAAGGVDTHRIAIDFHADGGGRQTLRIVGR